MLIRCSPAVMGSLASDSEPDLLGTLVLERLSNDESDLSSPFLALPLLLLTDSVRNDDSDEFALFFLEGEDDPLDELEDEDGDPLL
mmetsp:Transcript_12424/g.20185  ORF Transcript_12424/g.20185 Transcript_12424/m.20185 type:complete len:86 (-) Transcript_12424:2035-2292(-)